MASRNFTQANIWTNQATIGFLGATTSKVWGEFVWAFEERLQRLGWFDGNNMRIDYKWAHADPARYSKLARYFVDRGVDVIVTSGTPAVIAARKATSTIPIIFASAGDPVRARLVASLKRPGGNVTGTSNGQSNLGGQRLDKLIKLAPDLERLALVGNYGNRVVQIEMDQLLKKARRHGIHTVICDIRKGSRVAPSIRRLRGKVDALFICTDPLITCNSVAINIAAVSAGLPTIHAFRDYVEDGGLASYGPDFRAMFTRAADLVDQVLRGTPPGEIPVTLQKKQEFVINQSTAQALGLTIPKGIRRRATIIK
jgi:ABC-type uncharacterized transport system substrate-binding protein